MIKTALEMKKITCKNTTPDVNTWLEKLGKRMECCTQEQLKITSISQFNILLKDRSFYKQVAQALKQLGYRIEYHKGLYSEKAYVLISWEHADTLEKAQQERIERQQIDKQLKEIQNSLNIS